LSKDAHKSFRKNSDSPITLLRLPRGFVYLVAIIDWYSRKILSWRLSNTMDAGFCVDCLEAAIKDYGAPEIFNTDQGSQFTSDAFTGVLLNYSGPRKPDNSLSYALSKNEKQEMSESKRKIYTGAKKAKIALEVVRGIKTINEIAQDNNVHPTVHWNSNCSFLNSCYRNRHRNHFKSCDWEYSIPPLSTMDSRTLIRSGPFLLVLSGPSVFFGLHLVYH
jgi:transposase InsO family protein